MLDCLADEPVRLRKTSSAMSLEQLTASQKIPLATDDNKNGLHACIGPMQILARDKLIRRVHATDRGLKGRDALVYLFGDGEDLEDRGSTRIGGLPFWPREKKWPVRQDGGPMHFVGQLDFRPLLRKKRLPGSILTLHLDWDWGGEGRFTGGATTGAARLNWHQGHETNLIERKLIPDPRDYYSPSGPFYGAPVLLRDFKPSPVQYEDPLAKFPLAPNKYTLFATKIGGHSPFFGENWQAEFEDVPDPVFLASFCSVTPEHVQRFGLPARATGKREDADSAMFLDMGMFCIVYPRGNPSQLHWTLYLP